MGFLELVNQRLDNVNAYNSEKHYADYCSMAKRWVRKWGSLECSAITQGMVEEFMLFRGRKSANTANKELRYLRSTFNFGRSRQWVKMNPTDGINFIPVEKRVRYVPSPEDVARVILAADEETQDYLWTLRETMARISEVNRLTWDDLNLDQRYVVLYTRKKRGGHLTPRQVPMTHRLYAVLSRRYKRRDPSKPWVFWHTYWSRRAGKMVSGPYQNRNKLMKRLCKKAGVRHFGFHAIRHSGASVMDNNNVPIGSIQRILGHENRRTTEIYLHSVGEAEREAMAVFERASQKKSHTQSHTAGRWRCGEFP